MKKLLSIFFFFPLFPIAQTNSNYGIHFEQGLSWEQVKAKAKAENKYIFVDCYATWCAPCKVMDSVVYTNKAVGDFYQNHFISVKVQMNKTEMDDNTVKKWYNTGFNLKNNYTISAFPTFLFFSPDGTPAHKMTGAIGVKDFIELSNDAMNPNKQYYQMLKNFEPGKLDTAEMKGLARSLKSSGEILAGRIAADYLDRIPDTQLGDLDNIYFMNEFKKNDAVANKALYYIKRLTYEDLLKTQNLKFLKSLSKDSNAQSFVVKYIKKLKTADLHKEANLEMMIGYRDNLQIQSLADNYIKHLSKKELFLRENIMFIKNFTIHSDSKAFNILYSQRDAMDKIMDKEENPKGYIQNQIDHVIRDEEVNPFLSDTSITNPPWDTMYFRIAKKYGSSYAERNILTAKQSWYRSKNDYSKHIPVLIQIVDNYGPYYYGLDTIPLKGTTNNIIYDQSGLNSFAWEIFQHSEDKEQLRAAIRWMEGALRRNNFKSGGMIDTYANLLYKTGNLNEAIRWETKACELEPSNVELADTLRKMKMGTKTW